MKANELMLGDLIYYSHTEDGIAPYKEVIRIQAEDLCRDACIIEAHYEPIPLTPEILEKNGWKETWGWWSSGDCNFFMVKYADNSWAKGKYGVSFSEDMEADMFFIGSVHELQHTYRLLEIDKEIVL